MPRKSFPAALKAAFPHTVPILTGYLAVGLAYGLLMASKGYNFLWSGFVSAFAFCGSMQYVAITLLTTAFDLTGIDFALTALFVVLFIEQAVHRENRPAGFMGLACSVAGLAVFGADSMVIPAMVLTLIALLLGRKKLCA